MPQFHALQSYLERLREAGPDASIWCAREGKVVGRFFQARLTSVFQAVREIESGRAAAFEGYIRNDAEGDRGLSPWRVLDQAAGDSDSIALDRLCRVLHAVNFFRQPEAAGRDLYLSVDTRLLSGVGSNHGMAFLQVLRRLQLPQGQIVLQLPAVPAEQNWLLNYVSDNYRRNGFRLAVRAVDLRHAAYLLDHVRPDVIKLEARHAVGHDEALAVLRDAAERGVKLVFNKVDASETAAPLAELAQLAGQAVFAQGFLWDSPRAALARAEAVEYGAELEGI
jgi:EAL domain-containing protein (putative c-di-GMP-specific phosphodiesterase class I)